LSIFHSPSRDILRSGCFIWKSMTSFVTFPTRIPSLGVSHVS
jgi:hypothetical protein